MVTNDSGAATPAEEVLEVEVKQNSIACQRSREEICFTPALASAVVADFPSCWLGEYKACDSSQQRFLSCLGVHRSMLLFARAPGANPVGFVAFLDTSAMKYSLQRGSFLPEVVSCLVSTFEQRSLRREVLVHFVGDIVGQPISAFYQEQDPIFHRASIHMEAALRKAGFEKFNRDLLGTFDEHPVGTAPSPPEGQQQLSGHLQPRFTVAALDLKTGCVVIHNYRPISAAQSKVGKITWEAMDKEYRREKDFHRRHQGLPGPMRKSQELWGLQEALLSVFRDFKPFCVWLVVLVILHVVFFERLRIFVVGAR